MIKYCILTVFDKFTVISISIFYMYNKITIDNISVFNHTRIKLTKSSSIKCDETKIQNIIASSSNLSLCEVRDDRKLYFYIEIIREHSDCRSCTHSYMCVCKNVHMWWCVELLINHARCCNREKLITYSFHVHKITSE